MNDTVPMGKITKLPAIDLNLLKVFVAVMQERGITSASSQLGVTQPAVSNAIKRLRSYCQDPLFVKTSTGMEPTALAVELFQPISDALEKIRSSLDERVFFDPKTSKRTFKIMETDFGEVLFLPELVERLSVAAPHLEIVSISIARDQYKDALETGLADLALGQLPIGNNQFIQQPLFNDKLLCVTRVGNPSATKPMTLNEFLKTPQVVISAPSQCEHLLRKALGKRSFERRIVLHVASIAALPATLLRSNLIAIVPSSLLASLPNKNDFLYFEPPFKTDEIGVRQFWHQRSQNDSGHRWLRAQIAEIFLGREM